MSVAAGERGREPIGTSQAHERGREPIGTSQAHERGARLVPGQRFFLLSSSARNAFSSNTSTPSSCAFCNFEPASEPAIT